jgi:Family of unknown function (DUF5317)
VLLLAACGLLLLSPLLAGRWSARLLLHRWRYPLLIWGTLALQLVVVQVALPAAAAPALHVATYVLALAFLVVNRHLAGVPVVAAGAAANGVTIALNGGVLPASAEAVAATGVDRGHGFANSAVVDAPVLPWLGDVFAWPAPLPLANTFSVGDVLIVVGVGIAAWAGTLWLGRGPGPDGGSGAATDAEKGAATVAETGAATPTGAAAVLRPRAGAGAGAGSAGSGAGLPDAGLTHVVMPHGAVVVGEQDREHQGDECTERGVGRTVQGEPRRIRG